jgi:MarR family transcriptional regulator, organic hydroperoxide resistance regulator
LGLYQGQPPVLRALWQQEGLTQREIAQQLKIAPATVTKMLQRMEKTGFIQRRSDPDDQRVTRVYLTDAGRDVQSAVEEVFQTLEAETFANLTLEERLLLRRLLLQLRQNLLDLTGEEPWK